MLVSSRPLSGNSIRAVVKYKTWKHQAMITFTVSDIKEITFIDDRLALQLNKGLEETSLPEWMI